MTADIELPRSYSGLSDAAKPKDPAYGVYFYNLLNRRIERWNGLIWEVIAQNVVGMAPFGTLEELSTPRLNDAIAYAQRSGSGTGGVGGSGPSPAPGNTQSPTTPMAAGSEMYVGATIYRTADVVAANPVTLAPYVFDASLFDPSGLRSGSNIVVNRAGRWRLQAVIALQLPAVAGSISLQIRLRVNGAIVRELFEDELFANAGSTNDYQRGLDWIQTLAIGDAVRVDVLTAGSVVGNITIFGDPVGLPYGSYLAASFEGVV